MVSVFVVLNTALLAFLGWRVSLRLREDDDEAVLAWIVCTAGLLLGVVWMVDAVAPLTAPHLLIALLLSIGAEAWVRSPHPLSLQPTLRRPGWGDVPGVAVVSTWLWLLVTRGTRFVWDDLSYHAASPASWVQAADLHLSPWTYQAYYPFNAEMLSFWFMLQTQTDALASLGVAVSVLLLASAWVTLGRRLGQSAALNWLGLGVALASPKMLFFLSTFSANDLAAAAAALAALAFGLGPATPKRGALCGLAAGLALGVKVAVAPIVAGLGLLWLVRAQRSKEVGGLAAFVIGTVALGSYWYGRNLLLTGNPVFPAALGPFEGPLDAFAQRRTSLWWFIAKKWEQRAFWEHLLTSRLDWPVPIGLGAALGVCATGVLGAVRRDLRLVLLAGCALGVALLVPMQPFSGTPNRPGYPMHLMVRYFTFPFLLGLALLPSLATSTRARQVLAVPMAGLLAVGVNEWPNDERTALLGVAMVVVVAHRFAERRYALLVAGAAAALLTVAVLPHRTEDSRRQVVAFRADDRPVGDAFAALDGLPAGARVGMIQTLPFTHVLYYPLFGGDLRLRPARLAPDGTLRGPLHAVWRDDPEGWWWAFSAPAIDAELYLENLRSSEVDYLLVTKWKNRPGKRWRWEREAVAAQLPKSHRVWTDGYSEIWRIGR